MKGDRTGAREGESAGELVIRRAQGTSSAGERIGCPSVGGWCAEARWVGSGVGAIRTSTSGVEWNHGLGGSGIALEADSLRELGRLLKRGFRLHPHRRPLSKGGAVIGRRGHVIAGRAWGI